ncbi:MAG TPA: ABC transporter ATP-binding protein [Roseiflexaceae bacterium]|nr:ABC transporter ATP-binding protein [Roseiflexaceae bacterium]
MVYMIEARGITKRYGTVQALDGIDVTVGPGEVVGFLGPNGAGKTTAISVMLGLRKPTSGVTRLFGLAPSERRARERTGVMLQESGVPHSLRVEEVLRLFQSYYPITLPIEELLRRADLTAKRRSLIANLSGGQKQRLYFALAIAGDPDLLFLDEPTVGMDVETRTAFWEQVQEFAALGKAILFSTHYLEEADALASRIVVINEGRIVAEGTPSEIKRRVPNTIVRLRTNIPIEQARRLPGVQHIAAEEQHLVVSTSEPEAWLRALFCADWQVADLTVQGADLETAFRTLTKEVTA